MEACCKERNHMSLKVTSGDDALGKKKRNTPSGRSGPEEERSCSSPSAAAVTKHHTSAVTECCGGYLYLSGCLRDEFRPRCGGQGRLGACC